MANQAPYSIIVSPAEIYLAVVGTAKPAVTLTTLPVAWSKLNVRGKRDQSDSGAKISINQKVEEYRGQSTLISKAWRTEEDAMVEIEIADATLETLSTALNGQAVTTVAAATGMAGTKSMSASRGPDMKYTSLLIRGSSPYSGDQNSFLQVYIPKCYQAENAAVSFTKTGVSMVKFSFKSVEGPNSTDTEGDFFYLDAYSATAL